MWIEPDAEIMSDEVISDKHISREQVATNAVVYSISQLLTWFGSFLTLSIVPRYLGDVVWGQLAIAGTVVATVATVLNFSIEKFLVAEIARSGAESEEVVQATIGFRLVTIPLLASISVLLLQKTHVDLVTFRIGIVLILFYAVAMLSEPLRSVLAGWEDAKRVAIVDVISAFGGLIGVPFVIFGPVVWQFTGVVLTLTVLIYRVWYIRKYVSLRPSFNFQLWKRIVYGAAGFYIVDVVVVLYSFTSIFVLRKYTDTATVGVFAQAMRLQGTFLFIPTAIGTALLPSLTRIVTASSTEFKDMQRQVMGLMFVLGLPMASVVYMLAPQLTHLLYGYNKFQQLPDVLRACAFNLIPLYISSMLYQFLIAQKKNAVWSVFLSITVLINYVSSLWLIPWYRTHHHNGAIGAVVSLVIAEVATTIMAIIVLKNIPFDVKTIVRIMKAIIATLAMLAVMQLSIRFMLLVPFIMGVSTFSLVAWKLNVLGAEEQGKLEDLVRRKLKLKPKASAVN